MARKQCQVCGQPATVRVEANLNGRNSTMLLCDDHYRQLVRQQKRTVSPLEACSARAAACSRTSSAVTSSASAKTRRQLPPIPMTWSMPRLASPPPQVRVRRAVAAVGWPAASANSRKPCCRRPPNTLPNLAAPRWIPNICCWRWPTATWSRPSWVSFKIKVDDLKRQIESEAKRGDKPFEGEIGVSPRVKDALSRAFVASNELGHSYVGPEHFLIVWPRKAKGWPPTAAPLRPDAAGAAPTGQQGGRKAPRMAALRRRPTRQNSTSTRATDQDGARRQARPGDRPRAGDRNHHRGAGPAQEEQPGADRRAGCGQDRHRRRAGAAHGGG
ncbi:ATPase with chaperone activity, ATP-binding subunit [Klebsiella variicola]|nr:ATPase with chaperone activity, ATP-binding subunit [Klebsiella variicola]